MTRRQWIQAAMATSVATAQPATRPNIIVFLADDLGWKDVGYNGSDIQTPNIDRLAEGGLRLDRFYAFPLCSATRAGFMTGRHPIRIALLARWCVPGPITG